MYILQTNLENYIFKLIEKINADVAKQAFEDNKDSFFWIQAPQHSHHELNQKQAEFIALASWQESVDYYDERWKLPTKKEISQKAFTNHKIKGSLKSFEEAFELLGYKINIVTNLSANSVPGKDLPAPFHIIFELNINENGGTREFDDVVYKNLNIILKSLMPAKYTYEVNISSHFTSGVIVGGGFVVSQLERWNFGALAIAPI